MKKGKEKQQKDRIIESRGASEHLEKKKITTTREY